MSIRFRVRTIISLLVSPLIVFFSLLCEVAVQSLELALPKFLRHVRVDVHCCLDILMSESVLNYLDVHSCFYHTGGKGMPEIVTTEIGKQHLRTSSIKYCINSRAAEGWRLINVTTNRLGTNSSSSGYAGISHETNAAIDQTILFFERCVQRYNYDYLVSNKQKLSQE